jgi:hypothetical protein
VFRKMPEIFGTPGEPGPLWQRLNEDFTTRLLAAEDPLSGPPALVSSDRGTGQAGDTVLADSTGTCTGLTIALRSDRHPGSAWTLPALVSAAWIISGGYRFEAPSVSAEVGAGEYTWLHDARPCRAISLRPGSRALYLTQRGETS